MPPRRRVVAWVKDHPFGVEWVEVVLRPSRLAARGVAIGTDPLPYRLDYRLHTRRNFVTARLRVAVRGDGWARTLDLRRSARGEWDADTTTEADPPLAPPGLDAPLSPEALDCDIGRSPLTNAMPVLREGLLEGGDPVDLAVAWVSVPDLRVQLEQQRYTFVSRDADRTIVRFEDTSGFTAGIAFDADGLVLDYPGIAHRLGAMA